MALWGKKAEAAQTFSDIMRGMQHSVNAANDILDQYYVEKLHKYFKKDGTPITRKLRITDNYEMNVPLISLINPSHLCIDELEIEFKAQINASEVKEMKDDTGTDKSNGTAANINRSSFNMDFRPSTVGENDTTIRIKFKPGVQPEGYSRIMDEFHKHIAAVNLKKD